MLSKVLIKDLLQSKEITIFPFNEEHLGAVSYDLHLGPHLLKLTPKNGEYFDGLHPKEKNVETIENTGYMLQPGDTVTAKTAERIGILSNDIAALFDGKVSLAQLGLFTHMDTMLVDPKFTGEITVVLHNAGKFPILLSPGMKIGQLIFYSVEE